jgi:plastocyanin
MLRRPAPHRAIPLLVTFLLVLAACVETSEAPDDCGAVAVTREATLAGERLEPATLDVCRGQEVTLVLTVEIDAVFHIHGYDAEAPAQQVTAGEERRITFEAVRAGQFPIAIHTAAVAEATAGTLVVHEG